MKVLNYFLALGMTSTAFTGGQVLADTITTADTNDVAVTDTMKVTVSTSEHCANPTSRDYHDVLAAYNPETSDDYKFSGCGGVI